MDDAQKIRAAIANISHLRQIARASPGLGEAVATIKQFQSRRFARTYRDLAADPKYRAATNFFLTELYGERSYDERDTQFARIAGALQRMLPPAALKTAVSLSELHVLSESLDFAMGEAWILQGSHVATPAMRYVKCWRSVAQRDQRSLQLKTVLEIGEELGRLTKIGGLRLTLSAMRGPAALAGLGSLQHFLESGFNAFKSLTTHDRGPAIFLEIIRSREVRLFDLLFDGSEEAILSNLQMN